MSSTRPTPSRASPRSAICSRPATSAWRPSRISISTSSAREARGARSALDLLEAGEVDGEGDHARPRVLGRGELDLLERVLHAGVDLGVLGVAVQHLDLVHGAARAERGLDLDRPGELLGLAPCADRVALPEDIPALLEDLADVFLG